MAAAVSSAAARICGRAVCPVQRLQRPNGRTAASPVALSPGRPQSPIAFPKANPEPAAQGAGYLLSIAAAPPLTFLQQAAWVRPAAELVALLVGLSVVWAAASQLFALIAQTQVEIDCRKEQPAVVLAVWTDEITGLAQCLSRRTVWLLLAYMARVAVKFAVPRLGSLGIAVPMVGFGPGGLWSLCITAVLNGLLYSDLLDLSWAHGVHRAAGGQPLTIGQILF